MARFFDGFGIPGGRRRGRITRPPVDTADRALLSRGSSPLVGAKINQHWEPSVRPATAITLPEAGFHLAPWIHAPRNPDSLPTSTSAHAEPGIFDPRSWGPKLVDWAFPVTLDDVAQAQMGAFTPEEHRIAESTQRAWESQVERDVASLAGLASPLPLRWAKEARDLIQKRAAFNEKWRDRSNDPPSPGASVNYDIDPLGAPQTVEQLLYSLSIERRLRSSDLNDLIPTESLQDTAKIALEEGRLLMEHLASFRDMAFGGGDWIPEEFEPKDPVPEEYWDEFLELVERALYLKGENYTNFLMSDPGEEYISPVGVLGGPGGEISSPGSEEPPEDWEEQVQAINDLLNEIATYWARHLGGEPGGERRYGVDFSNWPLSLPPGDFPRN